MDITIDFVGIANNIDKIMLDEVPAKVFLNLFPLDSLDQENFHNLVRIYDMFPESSFFLVNVTENMQKQLRFLLERDDKIRIMPNETKRN